MQAILNFELTKDQLPSISALMNANDVAYSKVKAHCWYCNEPLFRHGRYCSKECQEAMFEDSDKARTRRMILGCSC